MRIKLTHKLLYVLFVVVICVSGCSAPTEAPVAGSITIDGKPANEGSIAFFPVDEKSRTSGGAIADGKYIATVPLGNMRVEIRVPKVVGQRKLYNTPNSLHQDILEEVLPAKFNSQSELRYEVKPGANEKNFELNTK